MRSCSSIPNVSLITLARLARHFVVMIFIMEKPKKSRCSLSSSEMMNKIEKENFYGCGLRYDHQFFKILNEHDNMRQNYSQILWPPRIYENTNENSSYLMKELLKKGKKTMQQVYQCINVKGRTTNFMYQVTWQPENALCQIQTISAVRDKISDTWKYCKQIIDVCRQYELLNHVEPFWNAKPPGEWAHDGIGSSCTNQIQTMWSVAASSRDGELAQNVLNKQQQQQKKYNSCALVGGAPTLLGKRFGSEIDAQDFVLRYNDHPITSTFMDDIGSKVTLHLMQNNKFIGSSKFQHNASLLVQIICSNVQNLQYTLHYITLNKTKFQLLSPAAIFAFFQIFDDLGGTGPLGVWLSLLLCNNAPRLYGFSTLQSINISQGFVHYYRGNNGEMMTRNTNVPRALIWLHVAHCFGLLHLVQ